MKKIRIPLWLFWTLAITGSIAIGFFVSSFAPVVWDDPDLHRHSQWLVAKFGLINSSAMPSDNGKWTGPLWALILGIATELIFPWLHDPYLVRHALTWALWPLTLIATYFLLKKADVQKSTALLAVAFLFGLIRFGGHALVSPRDFTHAAGFLLVTIALFVLLKNQKALARPAYLMLLGAISVIPFLLRSPDLLHFGVLELFLLDRIFLSKKSYKREWWMPVCAALGGGLLIIALSPVLWEFGLHSIGHPFVLFTQFPNPTEVRVFGMDFNAHRLPWWYPFAWLPVSAHPTVFIAALTGLGALAWLRISHRPLKGNKRHAVGPFQAWLFFTVLLSWGLVLVLRPHLYDEDRHLVFLFPPLFVLAALGLDRLRERWKIILSMALIFCACVSYTAWGQYAFAYKSPLVGNRNADRFMADYRAVCFRDAVDALQTHIPGNIPVVITNLGPRMVAERLEERRVHSKIARTPEFITHTILPEAPTTRPYAVITFNSMHNMEKTIEDIDEGRATLLWKNMMPPGDIACAIALYN